MTKDTHSTSHKYERLILEGLNNIDVTNAEERNVVYEAAFRALRNTHLKNTNIDKFTSNTQIQVLGNTIFKIETELLGEPINDLINITQLQKPTIFYKIKRLCQTNLGKYVNSKGRPAANLLSKANRITTRNLLLLLTCSSLVFALITWNVISRVEKPKDDLTLPVTISGKALTALPKALGTNVTEKTSVNNDGILFKITPTSEAIDNRINFQLHRDWAISLTAMSKPFLVTIKIKKLNDVTLKFGLQTIIGTHTAKTSVNIRDQNSNEIFILSSDTFVKEYNDIFVIILEVDNATSHNSEEILLLVENITISNI